MMGLPFEAWFLPQTWLGVGVMVAVYICLPLAALNMLRLFMLMVIELLQPLAVRVGGWPELVFSMWVMWVIVVTAMGA